MNYTRQQMINNVVVLADLFPLSAFTWTAAVTRLPNGTMDGIRQVQSTIFMQSVGQMIRTGDRLEEVKKMMAGTENMLISVVGEKRHPVLLNSGISDVNEILKMDGNAMISNIRAAIDSMTLVHSPAWFADQIDGQIASIRAELDGFAAAEAAGDQADTIEVQFVKE